MASIDAMFEELRTARDAGADAPAHLFNTLNTEQVYSLQTKMLAYRVANGSVHAGWKIGQTNRPLREERGETQPAPGFLLAERGHSGDRALDLEGTNNWFLEPELAVIMAQPLAGPGVTAEDAAAAIECVAPAYELIRPHAGWPDLSLQRAVNGSAAGYVLGAKTACPAREELDQMEVTLTRDGEQTHRVRGGEVNDNPLGSLAWLANFLAAFGNRLEAGHVVLTGTYCGLVPMAAGEVWRAELAGVGTVELTTA